MNNIFKSLCVAGMLCAAGVADAQVKWPTITQTNKPWTRWWWEGSAVNKTDLTIVMQQYAKAGLGGLEIVPIYGVKGTEKQWLNFLSPEWMQMLDHTLSEGKKLNLGIDMANGTGWPFGGPWIHEDNAAKTINYKTYALTEGQTLHEKIVFQQEPLLRFAGQDKVKIEEVKNPVYSNSNLQALALDQIKFPGSFPATLVMAYSNDGQQINLTDKLNAAGDLNWTAPKGSWTIYALFQSLHGKMVERAAPGGEGYAMDHFSLKAIDHYLGKFDESFKGHDLSSLRAFFNDSYEVDDATGQASWTPDFLSEFQKRRGYDLRNYLPALFGKDKEELNSRVIYDYRLTVNDLIYENYTKAWHTWSAQKGKLVRNQAHGSPANILDLYGAIDIPETEGTELLRFKVASSAGNVTGKPLVSSESATWLDEHFVSTLGDVKQAIDNYFVGGINHVFYHGLNYSPANAPFPGWLFYASVHFQPANPFWNDFSTLNNYIAHCQSFLQNSAPDNDVLLYYPFTDIISKTGGALLKHFDAIDKEFKGTGFKENAETMIDHGFAFDYISDKQLLNVKTEGNELLTGKSKYKTIILPNSKLIPLETWQQLMKLASQGATILVYKGLPEDVPGMEKLSERQSAYKQSIASLHFISDGNVQKATVGNGQFVISNDVLQLLDYAHIRKETLAHDSLSYIRKKNENGCIYFIANKAVKAYEGWINLATNASSAIVYNPMSEKAGVAKTKQNSDGTLSIYVQMQKGESLLLQTASQTLTGNQYEYLKMAGNAVLIGGSWKLHFAEGGPVLPKDVVMQKLQSWTNLPGDEVKKFSGTASYTTSFAKPKGTAKKWLLDLGDVRDNAEVFLNGKKIATLIGPVFSVVIDANTLQQKNTLKINVANTMANRIIDMEKNHENYKVFYNINFPARKAANKGADGLFTAENWSPLPSGLLTNVTLTPMAIIK